MGTVWLYILRLFTKVLYTQGKGIMLLIDNIDVCLGYSCLYTYYFDRNFHLDIGGITSKHLYIRRRKTRIHSKGYRVEYIYILLHIKQLMSCID
jgi:hypothetical protein